MGVVLRWARLREGSCLRITGLPPSGLASLRASPEELARRLPVYPTSVLEQGGTARLQPAAGEYVVEDDSVRFVPRFPFLDARAYTVLVHPSLLDDGRDDGFVAHTLRRPARTGAPITHVTEIWPTAAAVPRNALRMYVLFSAPMSEGFADAHVRVRDARRGGHIEQALLPMQPELWDRRRQRLTVLLDPARIKRGLVPHQEAGYALRVGVPVELVVDEGFLDAQGRRLIEPASRRYEIGEDVRAIVNPTTWRVTLPQAGTADPLLVEFDRPLDHALLERCIVVATTDGQPLPGRSETQKGETAWRFQPQRPWPGEALHLAVDPVLEDVAGNSVARIFDRDVTEAPAHAPLVIPVRSAPGDIGLTIVCRANRRG